MKKKNLFTVVIFFGIVGANLFAQQMVCVDYSFPNYASAKSTSSNLIINTFIGNTVIGVAQSDKNIIRTKSLVNVRNDNKNTSEIIEDRSVPNNYSLEQNYPNPLNPVTQIKFSIPREGFVKLVIYNLLGEKVDELVNEYKAPGTYVVGWNAKNYTSGVYIYNLRSGGYSSSRKLILLK